MIQNTQTRTFALLLSISLVLGGGSAMLLASSPPRVVDDFSAGNDLACQPGMVSLPAGFSLGDDINGNGTICIDEGSYEQLKKDTTKKKAKPKKKRK